MPKTNQKIGKRVAELRHIAKLTQSQLAEKSGVTIEIIGRFERGASVPSIKKISDIASALGVEMWQIFQFDSSTLPNRDAIQRLMSVIQLRSESDILKVADIAERMFMD